MRRPVTVMALAGLVASAIGIVLGLLIDWFPTEASTQARDISTLYDVLVIVSVPVFVLVVTVVIGAVVLFRVRRGQEDQDGPPVHGNTKLEVIWTAIPAALILGLCAYAYVVLVDIEKAPAKAAQPEMRVHVVGQQFAWTFEYPKELTGGKAVADTQLYLPIGRSVRFDINAKDVLHDFWVPNFAMKLDAVPGITTHYRVTPDRLGTYPVVCAELCGLGHSVMRSTVHVVTQEEFDAYLEKKTAPTAPPPTDEAGADAQIAAGKQVYEANGCAGCHALADAGSTGQIGPDLDQVIADATPEQIREDIVDPEAKLAQGYPAGVMPTNFGQVLSPNDLNALVAYLEQVAGK